MTDLAFLANGLPDGHGPIGLFSSDEFTPPARDFDRLLLEATGPRVGIILCADHENAPQTSRQAIEHFAALGARAFLLDLHDDGPLPHFDLAYLGGGSPKNLLADLHGNARWVQVLARWRGGAGLAGSSAGAMGLCTHCLTPEPGANVPTVWSDGLGPISDGALAVHAATRPREWLHDVARSAPVPLVAIDDATGILLREGAPPLVEGAGRAEVVKTE